MKLYEITSEVLTAIDLYNGANSDEELLALEKTLTDLQVSFNDKCIAVAKFILNNEGDSDAVQKEIDRLNDLQGGIKKRNTWLKEYVKRAMEATNTLKIDDPVVPLKIAKNPPKLIIDEGAVLPDKYMRVIPEHKEPDKDLIKADLKAGIGVVGTRLEQGTRLKIG